MKSKKKRKAGAGRKSKWGLPTSVMRVPTCSIKEIQNWLNEKYGKTNNTRTKS